MSVTGRARLNLTRVQFARRAKITTNTLRTLESGSHSRLPDTETLQKIARALKTTTEQLLSGKMPIQPSDPLLADLKREDLEIARSYKLASTKTRLAVQALLSEGEPERLTTIVNEIQRFSSEDLNAIDAAITTLKLAHQTAARKTNAT